jgi:hypothetical protein
MRSAKRKGICPGRSFDPRVGPMKANFSVKAPDDENRNIIVK